MLPAYVRVSGARAVPDVEVRVSVVGVAKVTDVGPDEFARYVRSLAWSTSTVQVPAAVAETVVPPPVSEQFAVPALSTA
jgi:hypothetical protein